MHLRWDGLFSNEAMTSFVVVVVVVAMMLPLLVMVVVVVSPRSPNAG